jgi:hypothetical protein
MLRQKKTGELSRYSDELQGGRSGFDSWYWLDSNSTESRPALRPNQPPIKWVPVAISRGLIGLGREANPSIYPGGNVAGA